MFGKRCLQAEDEHKKATSKKDVATWFHLHLCSSKKRDTSDWL